MVVTVLFWMGAWISLTVAKISSLMPYGDCTKHDKPRKWFWVFLGRLIYSKKARIEKAWLKSACVRKRLNSKGLVCEKCFFSFIDVRIWWCQIVCHWSPLSACRWFLRHVHRLFLMPTWNINLSLAEFFSLMNNTIAVLYTKVWLTRTSRNTGRCKRGLRGVLRKVGGERDVKRGGIGRNEGCYSSCFLFQKYFR